MIYIMITPYSFEYYLYLVVTILILIITISIALILFRKIFLKKKDSGRFSFDFIFAMFMLYISYFFSRLFYLIFDFILTQFNPTVYHYMPNIIFYKLGDFSISIGFFIVLYFIDKELLSYKMKRIPAILILIIGLVQLFYPVVSRLDFEVVVLLGYVGFSVVLLIFSLFLYVGKKNQSLRKYAYMIAIGILLIPIGTVFASIAADIVELASILYMIFFILLTIGIVIMGYGVLKFNI